MDKTKFIYGEVCEGLQGRGKVFNLRSVNFDNAAGKSEIYKSLFMHGKELKEYTENFKTVSGFKGVHYSDSLLFYIDSSDLDKAKAETVFLINALIHLSHLEPALLEIYFSGNKGFHLCIPGGLFGDSYLPGLDFAKQQKNLATLIAGDLECLDLSIYEPKRLIRIVNTINAKSGLHKIPLTFQELKELSINEIKELAKAPRQIEKKDFTDIKPNFYLSELWQDSRITDIKQLNEPAAEKSLMNYFAPVKQGGRNNATVRLIGLLIKTGTDKNLIPLIVDSWNKSNQEPLPESELKNTIETTLKRYGRAAGDNDFEIHDIPSGIAALKKMIENDNKIRLGINTLDFLLRGGIRAGEVMVISGKTSGGKTNLVLNLAINSIKLNPDKTVLFFSFEMSLPSITERTFTIETEKQGGELLSEISKIDIQTSYLKNLYFVSENCSIDKIPKYINHFEQSTGKKCDLVIIDYLGLVQTTGGSAYEKQSDISRKLKEIAKRTETAIISLSQITKQYNENTEIDLNSTRDSGSIVEAADFFCGIWKNEPEPETGTDYNLILSLLKNRRGITGKTNLIMSKTSLRITETSEPIEPKRKTQKGYKSFYDNEPEEVI